MRNQLRPLKMTCLVLATMALGLLTVRAAQANTSYDMSLSFSEYVLAAEGTDQQDLVEHYESWDSAIARIRKRNMPFIEVTNTSTLAPMTQFQMTIEKPQYEFEDDVLGAYARLGTTTPGVVIAPSSPDNGSTLIVTFTEGLQPNETIRFQVDIDVDEAYPDEYPFPDYRTVFFDVNGPNDLTDNSVVTATFAVDDGETDISSTLPDFEQEGDIFLNGGPLREYTEMDGSEQFELGGEVPEPSTGLLALLALVGMARGRRIVR